MNDKLGIQVTRTILVCCDQDTIESLKKIPESLHEFTEVFFFPEADTLNQLIFLYPPFKEALTTICFSSDSDKIETLAKIILGHWCDNKTTISSTKELLLKLQNHFPNYLASSFEEIDLLSEVKEIFTKIKSFDYSIENGYLTWNYAKGLDSGTIPYLINSDKFSFFQREVIAKHPRQFSELEGIL